MKIVKKLSSLALLTFFFFACDNKEDVHVNNEGWIRETTSLAEDPLLVEVLEDFETNNFNGRVASMFGDLNLDEVSKVSNDSLTRYSLLFNDVDDGVFANLILTETDQGQNAYIIQYVPEETWYYENGHDDEKWSGFTGQIIYYGLDGLAFAKSCMVDGISESCDEAGGRTDDVVYECYTVYRHWKVCIGNSCDYHSEIIDFYCVEHYIGDGPGGSGPGSPGAEDPRDCVYNAVGDCEPPIPPTPVSTPQNCGLGKVLNSQNECVTPEEAWLEDIDFASDFLMDPCLMEIWNLAMSSGAAYDMIRGFLNGSSSADLTMHIIPRDKYIEVDSYLDAWGITIWKNGEANIYFHEHTLKNSSLMFFATILAHELIHAEMYRNDHHAQSQEHQHDEMADHHREQIIDFLAKLDLELNGTSSNTDLYEALSWVGLTDTEGWNNLSAAEQTKFKNVRIEEDNKGRCE